MVFIISLMSLLGVSIVPFLRSNSRLAVVYKYLITLLISMGVAALVCDALLHLIPNVSLMQKCTYICTICAVSHCWLLQHSQWTRPGIS